MGTNIIVSYNGTWNLEGDKWSFKGGVNTIVHVPKDIAYAQLLEKLYAKLKVDRSLYDLKLEVPFTCTSFCLDPVEVIDDEGVTALIADNVVSVKSRLPLCVTSVIKNIDVLESSTPRVNVNDDPVPVFGTDDHVVGEFTSSEDLSDEELDYNCVPEATQCERQSYTTLTTSSVVYTLEDIPCPLESIPTSFGVSCGIVEVGKVFENKLELKTKVHLYAMKMNFEFVVKKSGTDVWYIICKDEGCGWRLRARKLAKSEMFEITCFRDKHTCSLDLRHKDHRQAAPWVIGHCIKKKYETGATEYLANNIREDIRNEYGIDMTYEKAWRCREKALMYVRGTLEASYQKLPSYLFMLQQRNPGTLIDFVVEDERFKYCFMSLGVSRRGFPSCRPVICVDGTFLTTKYGGQMLCATALDANNHIYPIAFGVVDSENHDSWTYFMLKLKDSIGEVENLAFVSDRHASIVHALETVFPDAYHGACYHHISMNVKAKFKTDHCDIEMWAAAYSFRKHEFHKHFDKIKAKDPAIANYLDDIGFEKWARPYFPGNRYNIMTSNYVESFNSKTKDARSYPITTLVEFIRYTLQAWFCKRRGEIEKCTTTLSPNYEADLTAMAEKARFVTPYAIGQYEFHVVDDQLNGEVNLLNKTCSCGVFQLIGIPCVHALSAALQRGISFYSLCSDYYKIPLWRKSYEETIYPCGNEEEWAFPDHIRNMRVRTPVHKNPIGRPKKKAGRLKKKRHPSQGEILVVERKCSKCGGRGHNRATCKVRV